MRDERIRMEAKKEAEAAALAKWSKELQMSEMKFQAQLKLKQENLQQMTQKLERATTISQ